MAKANAAKNGVTTKAPTRQMWRRSIVVLVVLIGLCFSSVVGKLSVIQIVQGETWLERATEQQLSDSVISPKRGTIYDSNMTVLAQSATVWTVIMSPNTIKTEAQRTKIADDLSALLSVDRDKLYKKTLKTNSQYEIVVSKIEHPLAEKLSNWIKENKMTSIFRIIEDYKRYYPLGSLLSPVLGFTGTDNTGLYGLEAYYNSTLAGTAGRIVTATNGVGGEMDNDLKFEKTVDAKDGNSLVLTIDSVVQYYAEKYLEVAVKETGCTNRGCCIVQNVKTGAIVAMATKGDFDPNEPMTITDPDTQAKVDLLSGDTKSAAVKAALQAQWNNKPVTDYYEPGSVFKTFTTSMALEEGVVTETTPFYCKGYLMVQGVKVKCHQTRGHGAETFLQALSNSCNPVFMEVGQKLGAQRFFKYFTGFGFTETTGIDMLGEAKVTSSLYYSEKQLTLLNLSESSFGQSFKITPIQMITGISAVANGGYLMKPYVVQQVIDSNGNVISNTEPTVKRQVISEETSKRVATMLGTLVNGGGSKNAYIAGYRMAGKTGTADKQDSGKKDVVASFAGFAPADNPQYSILVMLDEPQCSVRYGGTISAPVAQKVFAEALPYLGVEPVYTEAEIAQMDRTTPNVTGKTVSVAQNAITNSELQYKVVGTGSTVIKQVPASGESIPKNGIVVLYTDKDDLSQTAKVPNFKGMTLAQANIAAANANINLKLQGLQLSDGEATASEQSVAAEKSVPLGTVVKVSFVYLVNDYTGR